MSVSLPTPKPHPIIRNAPPLATFNWVFLGQNSPSFLGVLLQTLPFCSRPNHHIFQVLFFSFLFPVKLRLSLSRLPVFNFNMRHLNAVSCIFYPFYSLIFHIGLVLTANLIPKWVSNRQRICMGVWGLRLSFISCCCSFQFLVFLRYFSFLHFKCMQFLIFSI